MKYKNIIEENPDVKGVGILAYYTDGYSAIPDTEPIEMRREHIREYTKNIGKPVRKEFIRDITYAEFSERKERSNSIAGHFVPYGASIKERGEDVIFSPETWTDKYVTDMSPNAEVITKGPFTSDIK